MAEVCPVKIHKVTEDYEGSASQEKASASSVGVCPITGTKSSPDEIDIAEVTDTPSVKEYKKIRKVMGMITRFYRQGSETKKKNWEAMGVEIEKLEYDEKMARAQIEALDLKPGFKSHPKRKDYLRDLNAELDGLHKQKQGFLEKQKEFFDLYVWSKGIVVVCEWLELNLDHYCVSILPDLPESIKNSLKPIKDLTPEEAKDFGKGLDEIVYNLKESQDFFQASIDGRLTKYHNIEKEIIEAQLDAIRKFPEDNARRQYIEGELTRDLEYVVSNMEISPESSKRRHKMLKNHNEFFQVLMYNKEKLQALGVTIDERKYDPKFDHYQDD